MSPNVMKNSYWPCDELTRRWPNFNFIFSILCLGRGSQSPCRPSSSSDNGQRRTVMMDDIYDDDDEGRCRPMTMTMAQPLTLSSVVQQPNRRRWWKNFSYSLYFSLDLAVGRHTRRRLTTTTVQQSSSSTDCCMMMTKWSCLVRCSLRNAECRISTTCNMWNDPHQ